MENIKIKKVGKEIYYISAEEGETTIDCFVHSPWGMTPEQALGILEIKCKGDASEITATPRRGDDQL